MIFLHKYSILLIILFLSSGCAFSLVPVLDYQAGAVVETLASSVSLSVHTTEQSMAGNGYMVYRRPDRLHLVILSPFGTTMMEAFVNGERITILYPSRMTAYSGRFDELPDKSSLQGWSMMRWVMDADAADSKLFNGTMERMGKLGFMEKVTFENGLVTAKTSPVGDHVYYGKYTVINGVPLAADVDVRNFREDRVHLTLDEPEVNTPLDDAAFTPRLEGLTLLPLAALHQ